jgi:hypothetical protein
MEAPTGMTSLLEAVTEAQAIETMDDSKKCDNFILKEAQKCCRLAQKK